MGLKKVNLSFIDGIIDLSWQSGELVKDFAPTPKAEWRDFILKPLRLEKLKETSNCSSNEETVECWSKRLVLKLKMYISN